MRRISAKPGFPQSSQRKPESENAFIGHPVPCIEPVTSNVDNLRSAKHLKMLRAVGHRHACFGGELFHRAFPLCQQLQKFQSASAGEGLADSGELLVQVVFESSLLTLIHFLVNY